MAKKALLVGINKKGYIKLKTLPRNRIKYIITPKGLAEKARLTYDYMHRSINYFKDIRQAGVEPNRIYYL